MLVPVTGKFEEIMRVTHPPGRLVRSVIHLALVASMLALVTPIDRRSSMSRPPRPRPPWTASGPAGTFVLNSDGSITPPQMKYDLGEDPGGTRFGDQTWTLSTTAESNITETMPYTYTGYHAFFQVIVHLDAFVTHNGVTTTTPLVTDGPVICCTYPSGGFSYTGSHQFDVVERRHVRVHDGRVQLRLATRTSTARCRSR